MSRRRRRSVIGRGILAYPLHSPPPGADPRVKPRPRPTAWRLHARISRRKPGLYAALAIRRRRPFGLYARRMQGALI